jgi:hypothetical protein
MQTSHCHVAYNLRICTMFEGIKNLPGLLEKIAQAPRLPVIFHLEPFLDKDQREWQKVLKRLIILANREQ